MFAGPVVNAIPLASLIGLMFMVVVSTFKWESLKYGKSIPKQDYLVIAVVSIVTIFLDLATAVIIGVLMSTVMFAWEKGKRLEVKIIRQKDGTKIYQLHGILFFGSVLDFKDIFQYQDKATKITLDMKYARVMDFSALEAINSVAAKYLSLGKIFKVARVEKNCRILLDNAENITSIIIVEEIVEID
jgi:SulP family sulfate permease